LLEHAKSGEVSLASSPALIAEFAGVLGSAKFADVLRRAGVSAEFVLSELQAALEIVYPAPLQERVCRDPDDDDVLACALAAKADMIVSGDRDLLDLRQFRGIPIVSAASVLEHIPASRQ
jgi:putative PIN family toxin of toxin-antitoxin system